MVDRKLVGLLVRALSGDPEAMAKIVRADHPSLLEAQRSVGQPLVLKRTATVAVLRGLLDNRFPPADVQSWASLLRRGYVANREAGPIEPLEIEFEYAWEDAISEAISRLDEIGDAIDGEVTSGEVLYLLQLLGESGTTVNSTAFKRVIGPLSTPPSAYTEDTVFTHPGGDAELRCTYERDGALVTGGLRFRRVRAYQFRGEGHCTPWHIEDAYDTLVEVEQSDWVGELLAAEPSETGGHWKIRHFLIFIDGAGAYEVAAEGVEWLPEEAIS